MVAIIDVNDLASLASFQSRVRSRLLIHALAITAVPPKTMADEAAYASARQIVQTGGNGTAGNIPLLVAVHVGGDYDATDAQITAAIEARKSEIYNLPVAAPMGKVSVFNPDFVQNVRRVIAKEAQKISVDPLESAARKQFAVQVLTNTQSFASQIAQLAVDNPTGEPLTDAAAENVINRAIRDAFGSILPAKTA